MDDNQIEAARLKKQQRDQKKAAWAEKKAYVTSTN